MIFRAKKRYVVETLGSEVLHKVAEPIGVVDENIRQIAAQMIETMNAFDGIGLAAPQAGHALRMVVLGVPESSMEVPPAQGETELLPRMPLVLINPEILSYGEELSERDEGCLSLPEIFAPVVRPKTLLLRSMTLDGDTILQECGGLLARCIQHELDHLEGKVFTDRVSQEEKRLISSEMRRLEKFGSKHHYHRVTTK